MRTKITNDLLKAFKDNKKSNRILLKRYEKKRQYIEGNIEEIKNYDLNIKILKIWCLTF